ncbi:MAG TPA: IS256 family transposase [Burkholderiales bacterium]
MGKVLGMRAERKRDVVGEAAVQQAMADLDARIEMIQALIPLGLDAVHEALQQAVEQLAGPRYQRGPADRRFYRWGSESGSVYLADQKVAVQVPRVRDRHAGQEVRLAAYERLRSPRGGDAQLLARVLRGIGCRNYEASSALVPEVFGLSASTVSRRFIRASAAKLQALMERDLSGHDLVALFLDGKSFGDDEMVIAIGVTLAGTKVVLGLVQTASENTKVCRQFLKSLVDRGLAFERGLLCVLDGAKGFHGAVREVFGSAAVIQRCRWHKRENVLAYLSESRRPAMRRKLQAAYEQPTYDKARVALKRVRSELALMNQSAARSLDEGFEETLTLHRLGLAEELRLSFATTNAIESIQAHIGRLTDHVDRYHNSEQKQRWVGTALLEIEPRLRRVRGMKHLPALRAALQREMGNTKRQAAA